MLIGTEYKIESDNFNITLFKLHVARVSGKARWEVVGYYSSLKGALRGLVNNGVESTHLKDFQTIVDKQAELYDLINGLSDNLKPYNDQQTAFTSK